MRPLVSEFALRDAEGDATEEVLTMPGRVYMLCVTAFDRLPRSCARRMARLAERAREEGAHVVCLTPDPLYGVTWHEFGTVEVRCYNIDASTMKTMLRADNGLVVLDDGTITSKRTVAIFVRRGILRDAGMKVDAGNGVNFFVCESSPF